MKNIVPSSKIVISSRGQFVIPKEVRDAVGIRGGSEILVKTREDGVIELRPVRRSVGDLFQRSPSPIGDRVDVDEAITEAVEANDAATRSRARS
jgi:AbrB family looped-hinge helix DNA binding protein